MGTKIRATKSDGGIATKEELIGAILVASDEAGVRESFRIDSIEADPQDMDILLYSFSVYDSFSGQWVSVCKPDMLGRTKGFPLAGTWNVKGQHLHDSKNYHITCTSATIGKCVLMGYKPWKKTKDGKDLWNYHQACTRLLRADYCGNGKAHTRDGTLIEIFDQLNIQADSHAPELKFEAAWNDQGAVCVKKTRIQEVATLDIVKKECPERLNLKNTGENCKESFDSKKWILNRSK